MAHPNVAHPTSTGRRRARLTALWLACALVLAVLAGAQVAATRLPVSQAPGPAGAQGSAEVPVWQSLNRGLPAHVTVTALALDRRDPQRLYAGTAGGGGLWISEDGGETGGFAAGPLPGRAIYALLTDPLRPETVYAGTDAGLYRSADAGRTWQAETSLAGAAVYTLAAAAGGELLAGGAGPALYHRPAGREERWQALPAPPEATAVLALAASPDGDLILAGTDGAGLFASRDGGQTWQSTPEIGRTFVAALAFGDAHGRLALARTRLGTFLTEDGAASWQPVTAGFDGRVDALAAGPGGELYLGTSEGALYRRPAEGGPWQRWGAGLGAPGMFLALLRSPADPSRWFAGTAGGLYSSDDGGLSWRLAQPGPGHPSAASLVVAADGSLYLGNDDGVLRSADGGAHWELRQSGLPADTVLALAPATAAAGGSRSALLYAGLAGQGLYSSTDGGLHWQASGWTKRGVPALLVDPHDARHLYIRVAYERVYESRDGGQSWAARWEGLGLSTQVISLAMDPQRPGLLYAGATEGFFRSLDGAATWQRAGPELGGQTVFTIALDPGNGAAVYAGATDGVYRSLDGGQHWERWGQGLENVTVTALAFAGPDGRLVYAGTKYQGVFRSTDGGQDWQAAGLAPDSVNALVVSPDGHWVYAATGSGLYRQAVPEP